MQTHESQRFVHLIHLPFRFYMVSHIKCDDKSKELFFVKYSMYHMIICEHIFSCEQIQEQNPLFFYMFYQDVSKLVFACV